MRIAFTILLLPEKYYSFIDIALILHIYTNSYID